MRIISSIVILACFCMSCSKLITNSFKNQKIIRKRVVNFGPTKNKEIFFKSSASDYGLDKIKATNIYAVDFNSDGETDLVILPDHFSTPIFYQFDCSKQKYVKLRYDPFIEKNKASFLTFVDIDKNGVLDLFMGTLNQKTELTKLPLRVFRGTKKRGKIFYKEIVNALPPDFFPNSSLVLLDYDLDGQIDLYLGNWYNFLGKTRKMSPDRLLKGKGFKFSDVSTRLQGETRFVPSSGKYPNARPTMGVATCDLNQDGFADVMTAVSGGYPNKLWINSSDISEKRIFKENGKQNNYAYDGDGRLDPIGGGNTYFVSCTDYNNDGFMDIAMGELFHSYDRELKDRSSILTGGTNELPLDFLRFEYYMDDGTQRWTQADRGGGWFDYNLDGLVDLFVVNSGYPPQTRLILFEQADDHAFQDMAKRSGVDIVNPAGTIVMDIDRDGRLDLISGQSRIRDASIQNKLYVFKNQTVRNGSRSIRIYPRGVKSNSMALGAMLILKTKKYTQRRWVEYASGPLPSQNEEGILFGLPESDSLQRLTVRWPILINKKPLTIDYDLRKLKFNKMIKISVCEDGRVQVGKKSCIK